MCDDERAESILHRLQALDTREDQREFLKAEIAAIREPLMEQVEALRVERHTMEHIKQELFKAKQQLAKQEAAIREECAKVAENELTGRHLHPTVETRAMRKHDDLVHKIAQAIRTAQPAGKAQEGA
jgi:hypothetical protein